MRRAIAVAVLLGFAVPSGAGVITQTSSFELSTLLTLGGAGTVDSGFAFLERFDASLGTLTQVDVDITAQTVVTGVLPPSLLCTLGCVPSPYAFSLRIVHDFGLWPLPGGPTNPRIQYDGQASGLNMPFTSVVDFSHSLSFTALTDTIGFAPISSVSTSSGTIETGAAAFIPPVTSNHERGDFDAPFAGIPLTLILPVLQYTWAGQGLGGSVSGTLDSFGAITVSYTYEENAVPAPEPGIAALLVVGLASLGFSRRRR